MAYNAVQIITPASAGGAGVSAAVVDSDKPIVGQIMAIGVEYTGTAAPATTDVVVTTLGNSGPARTLLTLTDKTADGWFRPRPLIQDALGADVAANYEADYIADEIRVSLAQGDDGMIIKVTVIYDRGE